MTTITQLQHTTLALLPSFVLYINTFELQFTQSTSKKKKIKYENKKTKTISTILLHPGNGNIKYKLNFTSQWNLADATNIQFPIDSFTPWRT